MRKKLMACILAIVVAGMTLFGCGTSDAPEAAQEETTQEDVAVAEETEDGASDEISEEELAGLYYAFAESLQVVVSEKSMEDMSELLGYPCYVGIDDGIVVEDKEQFLALDVDKVFTDELVNAVENADLDAIEVSEAGFVVGDPSGKPNVTIGLDSNDTIGITGINY